jgi:hypothetical protein
VRAWKNFGEGSSLAGLEGAMPYVRDRRYASVGAIAVPSKPRPRRFALGFSKEEAEPRDTPSQPTGGRPPLPAPDQTPSGSGGPLRPIMPIRVAQPARPPSSPPSRPPARPIAPVRPPVGPTGPTPPSRPDPLPPPPPPPRPDPLPVPPSPTPPIGPGPRPSGGGGSGTSPADPIIEVDDIVVAPPVAPPSPSFQIPTVALVVGALGLGYLLLRKKH